MSVVVLSPPVRVTLHFNGAGDFHTAEVLSVADVSPVFVVAASMVTGVPESAQIGRAHV